MIEKVLNHQIFEEKPPVVLDIGASGPIPKEWEKISKYSHCIAFDGDDREFPASGQDSDAWKKYHRFKSLCSPDAEGSAEFFLTKFPFCSSTLKPDQKALADWDFAHLFEVKEVTSQKTTTIIKSLEKSSLNYVDWFKTDSQGTDLRLFKSLPEEIRKRILVADFEPGIIDAYCREDKLHHVLSHMEKEPFWVHSMEIKGSKRILKKNLVGDEEAKKNLIKQQKDSPCWCEISYINDMRSSKLGLRENLLAWVFSTMLEQHGFALGIARRGSYSGESFFCELYESSLAKLS
jgi:hypothetical protein